MSKLKLFGISGSRALRSLWAIEEAEVEYEHVPVDYAEQSKAPDYVAVNPNGRVPALVDGELTICESMAINLYLAKNYAPSLYPTNAQDEGLLWQWSVWGISEIEHLQMQIVVQKFFIPKEKRNDKAIASATKQLKRPLLVLESTLSEREFLLGGAFSIADLNVASVMLLLGMVEFDLSDYTHTTQWLERCYARPALARAKALP